MLPKQSVFPLQVAEADGRVTVRFPAGTMLSEANAEEFSRQLFAFVDGKEQPHLTVDLGSVTMLTSVILACALIVARVVAAPRVAAVVSPKNSTSNLSLGGSCARFRRRKT